MSGEAHVMTIQMNGQVTTCSSCYCCLDHVKVGHVDPIPDSTGQLDKGH